ncbi:MAG: hypothetical protein GX552_01075 [Chloroflexi bacterium]|nr:hypothetical protein [Chloroflexota bacterium]
MRQSLLSLVCFGAPLLLVPLAHSDQTGMLWERITTYPGGLTVPRVMVNRVGDERILYAVGSAGGLHLSFDGGQRWYSGNEGLPGGPLGAIKILGLINDPYNRNIAYAIVDPFSAVPRPMVYWTVDGGLNWQPRASLGRERVRAIAFGMTGDDLYVITQNDVLRAFVYEGEAPHLPPEERFARRVDDLHWLSICPFPALTQATVAYAVRNTLDLDVPTTQQQITVSPWTSGTSEEAAVNQENNVQATWVYAGTEADGLEVILDRGGVIQLSKLPSDDPDTRYVWEQAAIHAICPHPADPNRLYVGTDRGVYATRDGGITWQSLGEALHSQVVTSLLIDPANDQTLYAGLAAGGVYRSQDGGQNWSSLGRGLNQIPVLSLALDEEGPGTLYAGTPRGLWRLLLAANPE